jgi:hypothetical protein
LGTICDSSCLGAGLNLAEIAAVYTHSSPTKASIAIDILFFEGIAKELGPFVGYILSRFIVVRGSGEIHITAGTIQSTRGH